MDEWQRSEVLNAELGRLARDGWAVRSQTPTTAQLTRNALQPTDRQLFVAVGPNGRVSRVKPKVSGGYRLIYFAALTTLILIGLMVWVLTSQEWVARALLR